MPPKSNKKNGPSLYKSFVDAYMNARPNEKKDVNYSFLIKKFEIFIYLFRSNIVKHKLNGTILNGMKNMLEKKLKNI